MEPITWWIIFLWAFTPPVAFMLGYWMGGWNQ